MKSRSRYMDLHASTPFAGPSAGRTATLVDVFNASRRIHKRPDTLNYKSGGRWVSISSDEMLARAKHIAAGLHAIGVRHGDRVALLSDSRVEWTLTDAGCSLRARSTFRFIRR